MTGRILPSDWSQQFGLALSPMFEQGETAVAGEHCVLLDGGFGSFGLSVVEDGLSPIDAAGWAWSSDLAHHVAVGPHDVQVVRWDSVKATRTYPITSVQNNLDDFYRYLCDDRLKSNRTVVQHLVNVFGRVRSLTHHARLDDARTIDVYVMILGDLIFGDATIADSVISELVGDVTELRYRVQGPVFNDLMQEVRTAPATLAAFSLHPNLAIRHAGGQIFQEAHFDLVRPSPPDMFGYVGAATAARNTRGGTHFTPPALARSVVDFTLRQVRGLLDRESLIVFDPACGSGAFLHEAIRGLRRAGFDGALSIVGHDVSAAAITMAKFTLNVALRDWKPAGGAQLDVCVRDSLDGEALPSADVIVMNPPFISVVAQSAEQKEQLQKAVGRQAARRGDYSMAFVTKALESLSEGGAMGTLLPAGLLTLKSATSWRERLNAEGDVRLLASIGDFGMFSHAFVRVACAVIRKASDREDRFTVLVTQNEPAATGDALRELRKVRTFPPVLPVGGRRWQIFSAGHEKLTSMSWRILSPDQRAIVDAVEAGRTLRAGELFEISQGVQTGQRKIFVLDETEYASLPESEQRYFRKALQTNSISNGMIVAIYHMFFPHSEAGPLFADEETLSAAVPTFYRRWLKPKEETLRRRAAIVRSGRSDWWGLMRPRRFSFDDTPRIISKSFGGEGSFVLDEDAEYLPETGHVWIPKRGAMDVGGSEELEDDVRDLVLRAYTALLNSELFLRLVSFRSNILAGGQYDLSHRFVADVPVPNLWELVTDPYLARYVNELAEVTKGVVGGRRPRQHVVDRAVKRLFGVAQLAGD